MVKGLIAFREHFKDFKGNYVIIGGTACDVIIEGAGLRARTTDDIDIILVIEALSPEFVQHFWEFIKNGNYQVKEKNDKERKYYRFLGPSDDNFPSQIELFSREPDMLDLEEGMHLTPIPVDTEISSLSAILMSEDYYKFTIAHSRVEDDVNRANIEALIVLKARAFLDMKKRKDEGEQIDSRKINKHKLDVFRLLIFLTGEEKFDLPDSIKSDLSEFVEMIKDEIPDNTIFKAMGASRIDPENLYESLKQIFNL